jgi:gas vesicle protein
MTDDTEEVVVETIDEETHPSRWSVGSFLAGVVFGAAVGAGVTLLLAPASGEDTRRAIRRRARGVRRDAVDRWDDARRQARRVLREKKEALRARMEEAVSRQG